MIFLRSGMSQCTNLHPFSALGFLKKVVYYDLENLKNEENYFTWTCLHSKLCIFFPEVAMSVGTVDIKMVVKHFRVRCRILGFSSSLLRYIFPHPVLGNKQTVWGEGCRFFHFGGAAHPPFLCECSDNGRPALHT